MTKNWLILLLVTMLMLEYKTGYKKTMIVPDDTKITYPTTVIRQGAHKKYIDMRLIRKLRKFRLEEIR